MVNKTKDVSSTVNERHRIWSEYRFFISLWHRIKLSLYKCTLRKHLWTHSSHNFFVIIVYVVENYSLTRNCRLSTWPLSLFLERKEEKKTEQNKTKMMDMYNKFHRRNYVEISVELNTMLLCTLQRIYWTFFLLFHIWYSFSNGMEKLLKSKRFHTRLDAI